VFFVYLYGASLAFDPNVKGSTTRGQSMNVLKYLQNNKRQQNRSSRRRCSHYQHGFR